MSAKGVGKPKSYWVALIVLFVAFIGVVATAPV
jgi:flagellar basal body-associated protein FliL